MTNYLLSDKLFIQWLDEKKKTMGESADYYNFILAVPYAQIVYQGFGFQGYTPEPDGYMMFAHDSKNPVIASIIEERDIDRIIEILEDFTAYAIKNSSNEKAIGSWSAKSIYKQSMNNVISGIEQIKDKNHTV